MNGHLREVSYHLLGGDGKASNGSTDDEEVTGLKALIITQWRTVLAFFLTAFAALYYITLPLSSPSDKLLGYANGTDDATGPRPADFHLLISAPNADVATCKLLTSAAVAGYPTPFFINWNVNDASTSVAAELAKIRGVNDYLNNLTATHEEDLILLIDGQNTWMQLRAQVVIDRFFAINARANARLANELDGKNSHGKRVRQEIVFASQRSCAPWTVDDPACYAVPESTLVPDIFGPESDGKHSRPKYLHDGMVMGTARAMKKLFSQAMAEARSGNQHQPQDDVSVSEREIYDDRKPILPYIFGEQELFRELVRRHSASYDNQFQDSKIVAHRGKSKWNESHLAAVSAKAAARPDHILDFGIGIDYSSEISLSLQSVTTTETAWLVMNDTSSLAAVQDAHGIPREKHRTRELQTDIAKSLPPFWTFSYEPSLPRWRGWDEVNLLTNVFSGISPGIIQLDGGNHENDKDLGQEWWSLLWFYPHLRVLFDAFIYTPILPVAVSGTVVPSQEHSGKELVGDWHQSVNREFWPPEIWKGGARDGPGGIGTGENWIRFDEVCRNFHEKLFGDGKGWWVLPDNH